MSCGCIAFLRLALILIRIYDASNGIYSDLSSPLLVYEIN